MAMTPAEKMRAYRQRKQAAGFRQVNVWKHGGARPDEAPADGGQVESRRARFEAELQAERLKAARLEGRKLARNQDKTRRNGYIDGICDAAGFFVRKGRTDIAQSLLAAFYIDKEAAEAALQDDKRVKSMTLESLNRARAWDKPPVNF